MFHLLALDISPATLGLVGVPSAIVFFLMMVIVKRYRRCPSNAILVKYGRVGKGKTAECMHGGGSFVWPLIQDYTYLSLEPMTIDIDLMGALSKKNIRVNVPSTFTVGVSTNPKIMSNAAERLLFLDEKKIKTQAQDIILGQLRLVIATLSIEEINQDREKFLELVNTNVGIELNKIGLEVINVNIRDITDESGYISAIGKRAAAEAIEKAKVDVAEQRQLGETGQANADKEREVKVALYKSQSDQGKAEAEKQRRLVMAKQEAEAIQGEAESERAREVSIAQQKAEASKQKKEAEALQRVKIAELETNAVLGENVAKARAAEANAVLAQKMAEAKRAAEVARADAERVILDAEKDREIARLRKEELAAQEVRQMKMRVDAEAEADRRRVVAKGEADAILSKYEAEAMGLKKVLEAKAEGYQALVDACRQHPEMAPTLLLIEKMPELVAEQVKAIQNLKIDKITVWDSGAGNGKPGATAGFLSSMMGSLPAMHELAKQAGIELPAYLGQVAPQPEPSNGHLRLTLEPEAAKDAAPKPAVEAAPKAPTRK